MPVTAKLSRRFYEALGWEAGGGVEGEVAFFQAGDMVVEVIDPVADYAELMESLFDFDALRAMFKGVDGVLRENPEVGAYNQTI